MGQRHKHADVIIAWAEGKDLQVRGSSAEKWSDLSLATPNFYDYWEYRIKPPAKKYRVALFRRHNYDPLVVACNSSEVAENYESTPNFVRWLTDWIEYEE